MTEMLNGPSNPAPQQGGFSLFGSLGLDKVESDPNAIPDGDYDGEVSDSRLVYLKKNNTVQHVISYKVTAGKYTGATRSEFFLLYADPKDASGAPVDHADKMVTATPAMSEAAKPWYRLRLEQLGVPAAMLDNGQFNDVTKLKGIPVVFGVKRNPQGFVNVSYARKRDVTVTPPQSLDGLNQQVPTGMPTQAPTQDPWTGQPTQGAL